MASLQGLSEAELEAEWVEEDDLFLNEDEDEDAPDSAVQAHIVAGTDLPCAPPLLSNSPYVISSSSSSPEQQSVKGKESEDSLKSRLLINPNKAGTDGVDSEKVNKVIYETSKVKPKPHRKIYGSWRSNHRPSNRTGLSVLYQRTTSR